MVASRHEVRQVLEQYLAKSGHGEGSRGGHIIGHTKSGKAIYAHGSVKPHQAKALTEGHKYGIEHISPDDRWEPGDEHLAERVLSPTRKVGDHVPMANGHNLVFETHRVSDGYGGEYDYDSAGRIIGESYGEDPGFETSYHIADDDGNLVEGPELTDELTQTANKTADWLSRLAQREYMRG